jgi:serine/threonine protein phosphatase 1
MEALIKRFYRNTLGRDLIVGDIHGCFTKLEAVLTKIAFQPAIDRLFSVGDLVDRGPESKDALIWLEKPWFHVVQGNHEDMAIRFGMRDCQMDVANYAANGGAWNIGNTFEERAEFSKAFSVLPLAIEIETEYGLVGIVHAGCPFVSWGELTTILDNPNNYLKKDIGKLADALTWSRERIQAMDDSIVEGVRVVVVGHTPMQSVTSLGNTIFIDTGGWHPRGAGFTVLDAATLKTTTIPNT